MRVSTVIAAYNAERTIAGAIESALLQECADHEIIVVNDGSSDNTAAVLDHYRGRIKVLSQRNQGAGAARNAGAAQATGRYLAFLDADDIWLPEKLAAMIAELEHHPAASLAFSEYSTFSDAGIEYGASSLGHAPSMRELMEFPPSNSHQHLAPAETDVRTQWWFLCRIQGRAGFRGFVAAADSPRTR